MCICLPGLSSIFHEARFAAWQIELKHACTEKTSFPFLFTLNGIWSWWQFFFSILNQMEIHLVHKNWKENCHHDHIPFNVKGNRNSFLSLTDWVYTRVGVLSCDALLMIRCMKTHLDEPVVVAEFLSSLFWSNRPTRGTRAIPENNRKSRWIRCFIFPKI